MILSGGSTNSFTIKKDIASLLAIAKASVIIFTIAFSDQFAVNFLKNGKTLLLEIP
jgi:hypothetical protein